MEKLVNKMIIEYEKCYKKWVVFKVFKNIKIEVFKDKYKKNCKNYIKLKKKKKNGN